MTDTQDLPKVVVVTGDVTMDWNLARFRSPRGDLAVRTWWNDDCTRAYWQRGGAALLADLITAVAKPPDYVVRQMAAPQEPVPPEDDDYHHSFSLWSNDHDQTKAWRVKDFLGLDRSPVEQAAQWRMVQEDPAQPLLVVLDDADLGFRNQPQLWPRAVTESRCQAWILVKMARPVAQGPLWEHMHRNCAQRLIMVTTVNDLRLTQVQVSRELSWERTAQDLFWELANNPQVNGLADCAHVVVSFDTDGALLLSRRQDGQLECTLFFDPKTIEGAWKLKYPGQMIGYTSCLTAGIARQIMRHPTQPDLPQGIQSGVAAMRLLHQNGYLGPNPTAVPCRLAFPIDRIAERLLEEAKPPLTPAKVQDPVQFLAEERVQGKAAAQFWTILQDRYSGSLEEVARKIVEDGVDVTLKNVPLGQFGKLLTVDRREIESYRSIRAVLAEYCSRPHKRPISIAVFGPPGSGKSFGVEQVAKSIKPDTPDAIEVRTFNLSQFREADALIGALHQVRDIGLSGKMPLVFWDEFDSPQGGQELGWLRYFLSPMQDGSFQEGQITHPIGQAIFVFAGGTSLRMEDFVRVAMDEKMKNAKGPDFVSRLKGYVNIMGPDPMDVKYPAGDPYFLIRRAILLRNLFERSASHLFAEADGKGKLSLDPGVLRAFLRVSRYKHGVRSLESIIAISMLTGKSRFERSCLPPEAQLNLHVNGLEFLALVQQPELKGDLLKKLAAAVHEVYRESQEGMPQPPEAVGESYDQLSPHLQQQNRDFVRGIHLKLSSLGYVMIPARSNMLPFTFPRADLETLAEMEHDRWLREKVAAGWRYGPKRDEAQKTNPDMLPWQKISDQERAQLDPAMAATIGTEALTEEVKEKRNRALIRGIPKILAKAGYTVVKLQTEDRTAS